jgi:hypothetical protein
MKTKIKSLYQNNKGKLKALLIFNCAVGIIVNGIILHIAFIKVETFISNPLNVEDVHAQVNVPNKTKEPTMKEWVLTQVEEAGLDRWEADRIVNGESGWNNWAYNINSNGTTDLGLWQINSIHKKTISVEDRFDYKESTKWAINKRLHDGNWCAWVAARHLGICK